MTSQSTPAHHSGDHVVKTRYLMMVLDEPPNIFNILAWIFMWIVLAGFLVLPSSFPQIEEHVNPSNQLAKVVNFTQNIPLLALGMVCCIFGGVGLLWVGLRHSDNYVWLLSKIFIPGMFNGLSGLITTFVSIHNSKNGVHYGATTIGTLAATGACTIICGSLAVIYTVLKFLAKREHDRMHLAAPEGKAHIDRGETGDTQA